MQEEKKIKVAIVGSGLAGLTTAYLLTHDTHQRYEVEIFESGPTPSLDAASTTITLPPSPPTRIDIPMRAFAGGFYKNLLTLYTHLCIPYHPQNFLYAFTSPHTHHIHPSSTHRFPPKPEGTHLATHLLNLLLLYATYTYFTICAFYIPPKPAEDLGRYLRRIRLPDTAAAEYLLPLFSAVATCTHDALLRFPAEDLLTYRRAVYAQPHYVVSGGVGQVQERLLKGVKIHLNRRVDVVEKRDGGLVVKWDGGEDIFGRVVLAVNPSVAGRVYKPLRSQMERIPCAEVEAVVHTDGAMLGDVFPVTRKKGKVDMGRRVVAAAERLLCGSGAELIHLDTARTHKGAVYTQASHLHAPGVLVTTQPHRRVGEDMVLGGTKFTRVLRSCESREVVKELISRDGEGDVWVVGGWVWDGMVLLEGCVVSAVRVAKAFGVEVPW